MKHSPLTDYKVLGAALAPLVGRLDESFPIGLLIQIVTEKQIYWSVGCSEMKGDRGYRATVTSSENPYPGVPVSRGGATPEVALMRALIDLLTRDGRG